MKPENGHPPTTTDNSDVSPTASVGSLYLKQHCGRVIPKVQGLIHGLYNVFVRSCILRYQR